MTKTTFMKMKSFLCNNHLSLDLRQRMVKCYVWSALLYSAEVWTLRVSIMNKIEAMEMWIHIRMLQIPWTSRKTNEEVLRSVNKDRELLKTVKHGKMSYLGHTVRRSRYKILLI
ncbi:unnamed protein product [Diabrotica balteata]|uniref:Uncharacterized protein n=1 Tax=Diabrotica balteata TaxID=107213 RepID=A0A9N9T4Q8_DIABA|nr:unnamed protein product [Diabrotica balteata]